MAEGSGGWKFRRRKRREKKNNERGVIELNLVVSCLLINVLYEFFFVREYRNGKYKFHF